MTDRQCVTECRGVYLSAPFVSLCAVHDGGESISGWLWSYALAGEILPGGGEMSESRGGRKSKSDSGGKSEGRSKWKIERKSDTKNKRKWKTNIKVVRVRIGVGLGVGEGNKGKR